MLISAIAVQDETLTAFVDLSDHERAEQALRELSRQLRIFVRTAPLSIAMLDRDLRYLACSGRWLVEYGRGHADLVGLRHYDVHPDLPDNWREVHRRALAGETVHDDRDRWTQADGSPHWLRWVVLPWYDEAGTIGGIIISAEDITKPVLAEQEIVALNASLERRVAERTAELSAANAELDAFAYAVSHDLRAPLRALSGFSQALLEDLGPRLQGEEATYLQQIGIAAGRMGELIDAILALSRSTRSELLPERVDASALARRQLQELQQAFPERKVDWSVEPGLELHGDPRMLAALIGNLIENAWKYTGKTDAARIRVHGGIVDDHAEFCVDDNGAGFDMAQAQHLFKPFQRLHRQDEFPGMGIGLATAQRIARRHGGQIRAQGAPGQGASFCLVLPGA
jgi:PAS domain S-box-containing protein